MPVTRALASCLLAAILAIGATACAASDSEDSAFSDASGGGNADQETFSVPAIGPEGQSGALGERLEGSERDSRAVAAVSSQSAPKDDLSDDLGIDVQERLIIRNVAMTIVVTEVSESLNDIAATAVGVGGWVVSTAKTANHIATISLRVPAERLDATVQWLRDLAIRVEAETSTSQDVTEEFVDISARITNLEATEAQLRALFEREGDIEEVLAVQRELTRVREDIERLAGRKRLLQQTAATSLVTVTLQAKPSTIFADAGADRALVEGETARFRAHFAPPEGIDEFMYEWDFGDGTPVARGATTAPADETGKRTTATVVHVYRSQADSPFFVAFTITGTGDGGIAEGEDTMQATVTSVPNIQVSAGDDLTAAVDERMSFAGSFTRPAGVTDLKFRWDFGDGLAPLELDAPTDDSTIEAEHVYTIDRAEPYRVTLSVTGRTENGAAVEAQDTLRVHVVPASVWSKTVIDIGETARAATRAFSATLQGAIGVGIWLVIFSPVWVGLIALGLFINRRRPRGEPTPPSTPPSDSEQSSPGQAGSSGASRAGSGPVDGPSVDDAEDPV